MNVPTSSRLARYLTVILRWLAITFVVFVLTILIGVYITDNLLPTVYTASAQIQVRPQNDQGFAPTNFQPEFEIMQSADFLLPIITDLGLDKAWATRIFKSKEYQLSSQDALDYMHKILKLDFVRGTNIINITVSSDVPEEAVDIVNAIADRYKTLRDAEEDQRESPVRIISRAEIPTVPTKPDKSFAFLVMIVVGGLLSVMAASFVEIILLFLRAGERSGN
jgi:capsular polysaccharide biosynthesis protein